MDQIEWFNSTDIPTDTLISKLFFTLWAIWKARNYVLFNGTKPNSMGTFIQSINASNECLSSQFHPPNVASPNTAIS